MANKSISQEDALSAIAGSELIRIALGGGNYKVSLTQIADWLLTQIVNSSIVTIAHSITSQAVALGSSATYSGFSLDYTITRGSRVMKGVLQVLTNGSISGFSDNGTVTLPNGLNENCGVTFDTNVISGICNLLITTDNSDTNPSVFVYKINKF